MKNEIFDLTKKVSLITGGNGGIGLGIAKGLALSGSDIAIIGRNLEPTIYHFFPILAGATYAVGAIITNKYLQEEEPLSILLCWISSKIRLAPIIDLCTG